MNGFEAELADLPQYIRVITKRIWQGRRLDDIRRAAILVSRPTPRFRNRAPT